MEQEAKAMEAFIIRWESSDASEHSHAQLKANCVQTFNAFNELKDKDAKIIFRTV